MAPLQTLGPSVGILLVTTFVLFPWRFVWLLPSTILLGSKRWGILCSCFHLRLVRSVRECYGAVVFAVVRLVFGNTVLLALSRCVLVVAPFLGAIAARKPQMVSVLSALSGVNTLSGAQPGLRPRGERIVGQGTARNPITRRRSTPARQRLEKYGTYPPIGDSFRAVA